MWEILVRRVNSRNGLFATGRFNRGRTIARSPQLTTCKELCEGTSSLVECGRSASQRNGRSDGRSVVVCLPPVICLSLAPRSVESITIFASITDTTKRSPECRRNHRAFTSRGWLFSYLTDYIAFHSFHIVSSYNIQPLVSTCKLNTRIAYLDHYE